MTAPAARISAPTDHQENWLLALVVIVAGGFLTGALFLAITYQYQMIFFSPIVPSLAAFVIVCYAIWQGRIRGRVFCLALGLLLGVLIYGSYQGMRYAAFRQLSVSQLSQTYGTGLSYGELQGMVDDLLLENTGATGFLGYVREQMQQGMVIRSTPLPTSANQVTGSGYLLYWLIDAVFILGGALSGAWRANERAYCEHCHKYYGRITNTYGDMGLQRLGWIDKQQTDEFARLIDLGHFEQAGTLLRRKRSRQAKNDIQIERCDSCDVTPVTLSAYQARSMWSSQQTMLFRQFITSEEYRRLTAFADIDSRKPRLSGAHVWAINMLLVVLFLAGLMFLWSALQASSTR